MTVTASSRYPQTPGPGSGPRQSSTPSQRPPSTSVGQSMPPLVTRRSPHHTQTPAARSPSPNYFGFSTVDDSFDSDSNTNQHARNNWSPPSSTVRSTAAFSPTVIPVDQDPQYEAFRKHSQGNNFNLGNLHIFKQPPAPTRPPHGRTTSRQSNDGSVKATPEPRSVPSQTSTTSQQQQQQHHQGHSSRPSVGGFLDPDAAMGRSPKRHLSTDSSSFPDAARRQSPASFDFGLADVKSRDVFDSSFDSRRSLQLKQPPSFQKARAETVPSTGQDLSDPQSPLVTPQHVINLLQSAAEEILILDLRVSTQYARSRVSGALNLCIPTTLLKRPSFNVHKLAETFQESSNMRTKFEGWRSTKYIIVYDASSAQMKDATTCVNTIKKFSSEGYNGTQYIIKGGFADFSRSFPQYTESNAQASPNSTPRLKLDGPDIAPVIGGCPMPATQNAANPFFGNIRQNMDLIGGVGQMPVKQPATMPKHVASQLPSWLKRASDEKDNGARVSDKFLQIEKREQKRMQEALSGKVSYGTGDNGDDGPKSVQIAGIEKGSKNRYNNIWPFEHTRVKLQGVPDHGCDYVNANHISSSRSHKKYIATQGPIPATFSDFWNVVWQQEVRVIVMLTAETEGGQIKAHNYWNARQYGPLRLDFLSEKRASLDPEKIRKHRKRPSMGNRQSTDGTTLARISTKETSDAPAGDQPYVIVRKLALSHEGYPFERMREITQLQYSSWPDFGAPAHPAHLLGLVEQCDAVVRRSTQTHHAEPDPPNSAPILVHCSAGCGRTGTFCTVDTVIDMMKRQRAARQNSKAGSPMEVDRKNTGSSDKNSFFSSQASHSTTADGINGSWVENDAEDLIEDTVEDFRHQRISMVQSLRQFVLCYESVMEWIVQQEYDD